MAESQSLTASWGCALLSDVASLTCTLALQELDNFIDKHPEVLESTKVPAEDIRAKARILALLSLASQHNELSFAAIKVRSSPCTSAVAHVICL